MCWPPRSDQRSKSAALPFPSHLPPSDNSEAPQHRGPRIGHARWDQNGEGDSKSGRWTRGKQQPWKRKFAARDFRRERPELPPRIAGPPTETDPYRAKLRKCRAILCRRKSRRCADYLVVDAVFRNQSPKAKFPANREKNREFCKNERVERYLWSK